MNGKPRGGSQFQNPQPDDAISPLSKHTSQALVKSGREDISWARPHKVLVPLNESLTTSGSWEYEIEEARHDVALENPLLGPNRQAVQGPLPAGELVVENKDNKGGPARFLLG